MSQQINKVHIDSSALPKPNELGFSMMMSEITREFNHRTHEYIVKQMLEVNVDPNAIILHQQRIVELEKENEALRDKIRDFEKKIETIYNLIYQEGR